MNGLRIELLERSLQSCIDEYKDKGITFTNLDTKAQNTITIAGIFLAAVFAFLQGGNLKQFISFGGKNAIILLGASIILLLVSIVFCLYAMKIRKIIAPMESDTLSKIVQDMLSVETSEFTDTMAENFLRDQISVWQGVLRDMTNNNQDKAKLVLRGQKLVTVAIIIIAILLLVILGYAVLDTNQSVKEVNNVFNKMHI